jgi:hypothetical protein
LTLIGITPAARTLFEKRVLDSQKLFTKGNFGYLFFRVPSRVFAAKKIISFSPKISKSTNTDLLSYNNRNNF